MRDVVSVEHGRARLERRGDAVLERHDNSSTKESVYSTKRDDQQCSLERREKTSPNICLSPAQPIVCHSSFTKTNPMKHKKGEFANDEIAARRRPGPDVVGEEKKRDGNKIQRKRILLGSYIDKFPLQIATGKQDIPEAGTGLQCHLKKGPRSQSLWSLKTISPRDRVILRC